MWTNTRTILSSQCGQSTRSVRGGEVLNEHKFTCRSQGREALNEDKFDLLS